MTPPEGRNAASACRSACASTKEGVAEEVDAAFETGDADDERARPGRVIRSGRRGGSADSVAVVRCWFGVRRHVLSAATSASGSGIYVTDVRVAFSQSVHHCLDAQRRVLVRTSVPASNSACNFVIASTRASTSSRQSDDQHTIRAAVSTRRRAGPTVSFALSDEPSDLGVAVALHVRRDDDG